MFTPQNSILLVGRRSQAKVERPREQFSVDAELATDTLDVEEGKNGKIRRSER